MERWTADWGRDVAFLLAGALLNAVVLGALLWAWDRLRRRGNLREQLMRELGYIRTWDAEEGILRKAGLVRELNSHGLRPDNLAQVVLRGADLRGADLRGCGLQGAQLQGADLHGANLLGANLFGANLAEADLTLSNLAEANLRGADLEGANLVKSNLRGANLHRANMVNVNLDGATLNNTRLTRARFALRQEGLFHQSVHPSVEDWIRENLDGRGYYQPAEMPDAPKEGGDSEEDQGG